MIRRTVSAFFFFNDKGKEIMECIISVLGDGDKALCKSDLCTTENLFPMQ